VVGVLGTLDVLLPTWLYDLWFWALAAVGLASLTASPHQAPAWPLWAGLLGVLCIAATVFTVIDGAYLSFTPIGATSVRGVQGRYALPLLPLIGLVLPRIRLPYSAGLRGGLLAAPVLAAAAGLLVIPRLLIASWYLR
jgi:hypothetical protein